MQDRQIFERQVFDNGIKTEWEPALDQWGRLIFVDEKESRNIVANLNREAKAKGDCTKYCSRPID